MASPCTAGELKSRRERNLPKNVSKSVTNLGLNPALHLYTPSPANDGVSEREIKGTVVTPGHYQADNL